MQPLYNEFIDFLKAKGNNIPSLNEGGYWLDRNFIVIFTSDGKIHKLYKLIYDKDLSVKAVKHKEYTDRQPELWAETVERLYPQLEEKMSDSINIIHQGIKNYPNHDKWVLTSTGKDSTVVLDLVEKVIPDVKVMFNNTSLDVAETYKIVKSHKDWIITNPKQGFYKWVKEGGFIPSKLARGCCTIFKEGNSIEWFDQNGTDKLLLFMGVRNSESAKRADRVDINHNPKWGSRDWYSCLPIRKWSDLDVWIYMLHNNLTINPRYKMGYERVGCAVACPYQKLRTQVIDEYFYPKLFYRWHKILEEDFISHKKWSCLNCTLEEYHWCWSDSLLRTEPTPEVIQEMIQYTGLDFDVVSKYFNKTCCECGVSVRNAEALSMNYKFLGTDADQIYCKRCLKKKLNMKEADWRANINTFKEQGCKLF